MGEDYCPVICITDIRFKNEINFFESKAKFYLLRINSSYECRINRGMKKDDNLDKDQTEMELDDVQTFVVIENNGSIKDLELEVSKIIVPVNYSYKITPRVEVEE